MREFMATEFRRFSATLNNYSWPLEEDRWHELVFCIILSIGVHDVHTAIKVARETTNIFGYLRMSDVTRLAQNSAGGRPDLTREDLGLMIQILERQGFGPDDARAAVLALCGAASALQQKFDGKVQKYLRAHGQRMLEAAREELALSAIDAEISRFAMTNWLQNVLNMPIPLSNVDVQKLCGHLQITVEEWIELADEKMLNVALLDDWAADYLQHREEGHVA